MLIGIDANEANTKNRVGIGGFAFEMLWEFYKQAGSDAKINYLIYLKETKREELPKENNRWKYRIIGPKKLWTQFALPLDLFFHKPSPDVFFSTTHYAPRFCSAPSVVSVMDLSYMYYPYLFKKRDLYKLDKWTSYSVKQAKKVLTISKSSKDDIIKYYKLEPNNVRVVYPGIKLGNKFIKTKNSMNNLKLLKEKYSIQNDYVLFVGTLQPRKNIQRLIEAFSKVDSPSLDLVIIGKKGWMYEEILKAPKKFEIENKVKFLDYVSDEDIPAFYKNAECFILPSLYEGFGLPVLEAMKYGCPVLTSNVSSLPEAGGGAAVYFDPLNVSDISAKIKLVLENKGLQAKMAETGLEQVKKFSWEKAAFETLEILKEAARK